MCGGADPNLDCLDFYDTAPEQTCALYIYVKLHLVVKRVPTESRFQWGLP
jgi:hypothetical protein